MSPRRLHSEGLYIKTKEWLKRGRRKQEGAESGMDGLVSSGGVEKKERDSNEIVAGVRCCWNETGFGNETVAGVTRGYFKTKGYTLEVR